MDRRGFNVFSVHQPLHALTVILIGISCMMMVATACNRRQNANDQSFLQGTGTASICRAYAPVKDFRKMMEKPRKFTCRVTRASPQSALSVPLNATQLPMSCKYLPKADPAPTINLSYCQANDLKVKNSTQGSCLAMSWYWAKAQIMDEAFLDSFEKNMSKGRDLLPPSTYIEESEALKFLNILNDGMTDEINDLQLTIQKSNLNLYSLINDLDKAKQAGNTDRARALADEIVKLRQDNISFLKLEPLEPNVHYNELSYSGQYPSHNQYPDIKLYTIPYNADFTKVLGDIQTAIKKKVEASALPAGSFPFSQSKSGTYIFHLLGDGTAHAMSLKYTVYWVSENSQRVQKKVWTFFDPSIGEIEVIDDSFVAAMMTEFTKKRYTNATAYAFHEVTGIKPD